MFDLDQFIADCRAAHLRILAPARARGGAPRRTDPTAVLEALGEPQRAGLHKLYQSDDLTILNRV